MNRWVIFGGLVLLIAFFAWNRQEEVTSEEPVRMKVGDQEVIVPSFKPLPTVEIAGNQVPEEYAKALKVLQETPACRTVAPALWISVTPEQLKGMHLRQDQIQGTLEIEKQCFKVGQKVRLIMPHPKDSQIWVDRGEGTVLEILSSGSFTFHPHLTYLGKDYLLAPVCFDSCDRVVSEIPSLIEGQKPVVLDVRDLISSPRLALPDARRIPLRFDTPLNDETYRQAGPPQGKHFVIVGNHPRYYRRHLHRFMKGLKERGAGSVSWVASGFEGMNELPLFPRASRRVREIGASQVPRLVSQGAKLLFVGLPNVPRQNLIPGSLIIGTDLNVRYAGQDISERYRQRATRRENFAMSTLPKDRKTSLIVYGYHPYEWNTSFFTEILLKAGYSNIYWLRGGWSEYQEAKELGLLEK